MRSARAPGAAGFKAGPGRGVRCLPGGGVRTCDLQFGRLGTTRAQSPRLLRLRPEGRSVNAALTPGPVRSEVGRERAYRTCGLAGALHRPLSPAGRPTANRPIRAARYRREGRPEDPRRGRLGRCLAARPVRLGVQGKARGPGRRLHPSSCCMAGRWRTHHCSSSATSTASSSAPTSPTRRHSCTASTLKRLLADPAEPLALLRAVMEHPKTVATGHDTR